MQDSGDIPLVNTKEKLKLRIPKEYIISFKTKMKKRWDVMIMVLAIYNSFIIPYDIVFKPYFRDYWSFIGINYFIDIIFIFDLIVGFFTSFINNKGIESFDSAEIAKHHTG